MKRASISVVLTVLLITIIFSLSGCTQPGETAAEGHQRHRRSLRVNQESLMGDIDRVLLNDKPSRLSDKRIPPRKID